MLATARAVEMLATSPLVNLRPGPMCVSGACELPIPPNFATVAPSLPGVTVDLAGAGRRFVL